MKIYDISQNLHHNTPCWPGDTPFQYEVSSSITEFGSINVGKITTTTHIGTHVDAPFHFDEEGERIGEIPLERYIGKALVVDLSGRKSIGEDDIKDIDLNGVSKLLIFTNTWKDYKEFPQEIPFLRNDLAPYLSAKNIDLIGVDVPSVDPLDSTELEAHHLLYKHNIYILEGIVLAHVPPGIYELIALPLKLDEADGSPVRAVLIKR